MRAGERPFKCDSCNYLAANQHEVTRHARQVHNGPKPLACPYCEYKTADRSNFKKHVELHLNPRQFLCPLCKYAASKKCNLQYHIKSRHSGCHVTVDVSKVKLRVKKPERPAPAREDSDGRGLGGEPLPADETSGPVDPSLGGSARAAARESPRKGRGSAENAAREKDIATRQKKTGEEDAAAAATSGAAKAKRRGKKTTGDGAPTKDERDKSERPAAARQRDGDESGEPRRAGGRKSERRELLAAPEGPRKEKSKKRKAAQALDLSRASAPKARRAQTGHRSPSAAKRSFPSGSPAKRTRRSTRKSPPLTADGQPGARESSAHPDESTPAAAAEAPSAPAESSSSSSSSSAPPAPPLPGQRGKASEPDDDEGVHSSHEGGDGDVSDGASEGSDDSGLNGNGAGEGKTSEHPRTPACEVPAPTEVKGHTCIFCDRHFPAEPEYRRHLNRHLVNVYYMNAAAPGSH